MRFLERYNLPLLVKTLHGKKEEKAILDEAINSVKNGDEKKFNEIVARENALFDKLKDILYMPEEADDVIARVYNMAVVVNGEADAKSLRKRMKALYEVRNFAEMRAILAAFVPRYDEWIRANVHGVPAPFTPEMDGNGGFDGWVIQRWGWKIVCGFVNLITLYLAKPFTICWMRRWECKHTVYKGKRLTFDGNGLQLWGKYIVWWLLCIVTLGIYTIFMPIRLEKWRAKHTHLAGEIAEFGGGFDGWVIQRLGWNILCKIVNAITLFIAYPATLCWKEKWYFKHRVYDGVRLRFNGKGIQLFGKWIQWLLLCVVTLGIYALFLPIRVEKWKAKHVTLATYKEYWGGMFSGHRNPVDINAISVEAYLAEHAHDDGSVQSDEVTAEAAAEAPAAARIEGSYIPTPAYEGQTTEHYSEDTEAMHDDPAPTSDGEQGTTDDGEQEQNEASYEYIQPRMSEKGKKGIMITICASYGLLLLAGILFLAVPSLSNVLYKIGICEEPLFARAYGITIGLMWIALLPTIGYYFVTISPYKLEKKPRIIIAACTTALLVVTNIIFFAVTHSANANGFPIKWAYQDGSGSDVWFVPMTMIGASLTFVIAYALTMFRLSPDKINNKRPEKDPEGNAFDTIKYFFKLVLFYIVNAVKRVLKFKEERPDVFILIVTLATTWLVYFVAFILFIVAMVLMATAISLVVLKVMKVTGFDEIIIDALTAEPSSNKDQIVITECGHETVLTLNRNAVGDSRYDTVWEDEHGNKYISSDGGKTVRKQ